MSLTKEQIAVFVEDLRLQGQECTGYTDGVLAALVFIIIGVCPAITVQDLYGFPEQAVWQLACTAHHKQPHHVDNLPPIIKLSRGERFAITYGLEKKTPDLPTGTSILELMAITHGPLMARCMHAITYPLAPRWRD